MWLRTYPSRGTTWGLGGYHRIGIVPQISAVTPDPCLVLPHNTPIQLWTTEECGINTEFMSGRFCPRNSNTALVPGQLFLSPAWSETKSFLSCRRRILKARLCRARSSCVGPQIVTPVAASRVGPCCRVVATHTIIRLRCHSFS